MSFELQEVVPWGRSFNEYKLMFSLSDSELGLKILGCGDGPASFNAEGYRQGVKIISVDPAYRLSVNEFKTRFSEVKNEIIAQVRNNQAKFKWQMYESVDDLVLEREKAFNLFIDDFEDGKKSGRYMEDALPGLSFSDRSFDLALVSHLLFLYSEHLSLDFHIDSIHELMRVSNEVRIFPILDLSSNESSHLNEICQKLKAIYSFEIIKVNYEFQIGGNKMLKIKRINTG